MPEQASEGKKGIPQMKINKTGVNSKRLKHSLTKTRYHKSKAEAESRSKRSLLAEIERLFTDEEKEMFTLSRRNFNNLIALMNEDESYKSMINDKDQKYNKKLAQIIADIFRCNKSVGAKTKKTQALLISILAIKRTYIMTALNITKSKYVNIIKKLKTEVYQSDTLLPSDNYSIAAHIKSFKSIYQNITVNEEGWEWNAILYLDKNLFEEFKKIYCTTYDTIKKKHMRQRKKFN